MREIMQTTRRNSATTKRTNAYK